ncbi:uncharacterized protein LOC123540516 [Mercenaria mercenaria]|uniref:uncharacterized protein LOC123540516 n=1 Tax=Mercenaria mercenaria TaxID=6596 RepID=UPI00234FA133|nr:uncharacterized protein LOC123540516 [Mercenaria mercenaria]
MSILSIFVLLCCIAVHDSSDTCSGDSCKKFQLNKDNFNKRLRGHGLYEMIVPGHHDCVRNCLYLSVCKSIDFYRKDKTCKLNDVNSTQVTNSDFEQQNGAIFSDITVWPCAMAGKCGSRPCSKRQRCIQGEDTHRCADISCGRPPYVQNGKATLVTPGGYMYGDNATVTCDTGYSPAQTTVQCNILEKWDNTVCVKNQKDEDDSKTIDV